MDFMTLFELHPVIFGVMIFFVVVFLISFVKAFFSEENHRSSSILRFAPSVMTSLGLLGTFWSLISSLGMLGGGIGDGGQIDMDSIASFMTGLEKVFYFSVMGIGSAIFFMGCNLMVTQKNSRKARDEKVEIVNYQYELNESSNQELKNQSEYLSLVKRDIGALTQTMSNMQSGYDANMLGKVISGEIERVLTPPLNQMVSALQKSHGDNIKNLLIQLTQEVLVPIKNEIAKTTQSTNEVVKSLNANQEMNKNLTIALSQTIGKMSDFVSGTTQLMSSMEQAVKDMKQVQQDQKALLEKFNQELKANLETIKPAIIEGMDSAKKDLTQAIELTTSKMNTAMTGVIDGIAIKVVDNLGGVLTDFNEKMDTHLERMNTGLETTGKHVQGLLDTSTESLKSTLGEIDATLAQSSQKLQKELQAFRDEYQVSLTEFFTKQNEALEKTLGVQNERLQSTSEKLENSFDEFIKHQQEINKTSNDLIQKQGNIYEPLLSQMAVVAGNLNKGQTQMVKELRDMQEHTHAINEALKDVGHELPKKFGDAFAKLNEQYIDRFNTSNEMLQKSMHEFTVASAALLTTTKMTGGEL